MIQKILLGPVLLVQGKWVRYKTPLLPEPVEIKTGVTGHGEKIRILLMGDSSAAGVGAESAELSLLGQLVALLSKNYQVHFKLLAKTGRTTQSMLSELNQQQAEHFDFVVTALGVNDVTAQVSVKTWLEQQNQLVEKIKQLYTPQQIIMSGLPPMEEFPALPWPLNVYMGRCASQLDEALQVFCENNEKLSYLSFRAIPNHLNTAKDGFHPGPQIYTHWAHKIVDSISAISEAC